MGNIEDFQRQFTSVMENLLHLAVTETTKLFESAVQELKAEHAWIQKQNDKDTLCSYQRSIPEWSGNPCTRDIGVQVRVTPMVVERSCSPGSQHEDTDKTRFSGSFPGLLQDENQQFTLLFIKPEEVDMYDYTPACLLPKLAEDCPKPFLVQHIEASVMSQEAGVLPVRPSPYQGMPDNATSPFTHNPTSSIPQAVQECALPAPVETPQSQELNPSDYFHASLELMTDTQKEKYVRLLQPPTPTPTSSLTDAADGSISATKDVAKLSYQGQPRRLMPRKSKSVYRPLVDLETPQHDGENIQHANATSASTFHVPTKVRKKTGKKSYNWPSRNQPGKNEQLKSQLGRSHRNEYKCEVCERVLSSASHLKRHWKIHSVMRDSVCSKCGKVFPTERSLSGHMLIHTSDSCYQRLEDVATVETRQADDKIDQQSLGSHQKIRQDQSRRLSARKSKSVYRHLVDLETPQHDGENIQHANATSASTFHVPTKVRKKTGKKSYNWPRRNQPDKNEQLKTQLGRSHRNGYKCEVCERVLSSASHLKRHWKVHSVMRDSVCSKCGKVFPTERSLSGHMLIHTSDSCYQRLEDVATVETRQADDKIDQQSLGSHQKIRQDQSRRLSARKSKSVYRHLVDLETPQHDGENIQHANATSASTFHVPTKVRKKTGKKSYNWPRRNQPDKNEQLKTQLGRSHRNGYKCEVCERVLSSASHLKRHWKVHSVMRDSVCSKCGKVFPTERSLSGHMLIHTSDSCYQRLEDVATVETRQADDKIDQQSLGSPSDHFHATLELMTDTQKEKYVRLLQPPTPTPTSSLTDAADGSISATKDVAKLSYQGQPRRLMPRKSKSIYRHLVDLDTPKPNAENILQENDTNASTCYVPTKVCKETTNKSSKQPSKNRPGKHQCEVCGRVLSSASSLEHHQRVHRERPFVCDVCGKTFPDRSGLRCHLRIHTAAKHHQCLECGKTFNFFSVLTRHKITHTGEGPFSCSLCGKRFLSEMSKDTHMRTHGVEKPHICTLCGKGFSLLGTLWRHKRTHTGEKPYSCLTCGSRFKDRSSLREHKRIHTGEKPYQCKICGKKFRLSSGLRYHVSKGPCQETLGLITGLSHSTGK